MKLLTVCTLTIVLGIYANTGSADTTPTAFVKWVGNWQCNLDGRPARIQLFSERIDMNCSDGLCEITSEPSYRLAGRISSNGFPPWKKLESRGFRAEDPKTKVSSYILPLRYDGAEDWFVMMHTWNKNYLSGFSRWNGTVYGLQCQKITPIVVKQ